LKSVFIDSNIFISFANKRDRDHLRSKELMNKVRKSDFGRPYSSDYVFDEAVTTALVRTKRLDLALKVGKIILGSKNESIPPTVRLIRVDERIFLEAWSLFNAGRFEGLSFTDHTILAQLKEYDIDTLISYDTGFDGLTSRIS
jgi:predicted nucleic acid-binding protein